MRSLAGKILFLTLVPTLGNTTDNYFQARQNGNNLILDTPYGKKTYFGPLDFEDFRDYRVTIPLSALREKKNVTSNPEAVHNFDVNVDELVNRADLAFQSSDYKGALETVQSALERSPKNVRALMMQGSLLHLLGNRESAKKSWEKALALDPANEEIRRVLEKYK